MWPDNAYDPSFSTTRSVRVTIPIVYADDDSQHVTFVIRPLSDDGIVLGTSTEVTVIVPTDQPTVDITGLLPGTSYYVYVKVTSGDSETPLSSHLPVATLEEGL